MPDPDAAPVRIAIRGAGGRMGSAIARLAAGDPAVAVVGGMDRATDEERAREMVASCDVVIDVSSPEGTRTLLDHHAGTLAGRALVVGTTGLDAELHARLHGLRDRVAILVAANFSMGVALLLALVRRAAAALPGEAWDAEIIETHHAAKVDAPSGTALAIGEAIAQGRGGPIDRRDGRAGRAGPRPAGEVGFHAVRGGGVVGEHRTLFLGARERIEIAHAALDRDVFAAGALAAARWLAGRTPGLYGMDDVLGE
jgi:4-hydroxy-tetrahydrodipicolinate reductase